MAVSGGFDVQVCEGQADLEALGHGEVPLSQQVGGVRVRVERGLDLSVHRRL